MKTYNDIYLTIRNSLLQAGIEAGSLEARLILADAAGKEPSALMRDLKLYTTQEVEDKAMAACARRLDGEPVAYITGSWEFYGLPMKVTRDVLIPRMDTEVMIDAVKELLIGRQMDARILDLCCGSGCIACAIAKELPASKITAVDISALALDVARENVAAHRLESRVICRQADATAAPPYGIGWFDMIVSNPPYIKTGELAKLDASVRNYEPMWALDGGKDGLKFYKAIIRNWRTVLRPGGRILFEVGEEQADDVSMMLESAGFNNVMTRKDTLGVERVVIAQLSETVLDLGGAETAL